MEIYFDELNSRPPNNFFEKNYKILKFLGSGSYGKVVKCLEIGTNQIVAVKIIDTSKYTNKYLNKIRSEYKILETINHPNIVQFRKFFECNDKYHIIMNFLEGGNLNKHIIDKQNTNCKLSLFKL